MSGSIRFFSENTLFKLQKKRLLRRWIEVVISKARKEAGEINFIFCDDDFLLEMNKRYLNHDTLTDILTFPLEDSNSVLSGEIYISIPRVKENAKVFQQRTEVELCRVIIHGILHLLGFSDTSEMEREEMHRREDSCLLMLSKMEARPVKKNLAN